MAQQQHEGAVQCLQVLREHNVPIRRFEQIALDAQPYAMACGTHATHESVKSLMQAYIATGDLDIDAPLHKQQFDVGGCLPLDGAIYAGGPARGVRRSRVQPGPWRRVPIAWWRSAAGRRGRRASAAYGRDRLSAHASADCGGGAGWAR